MRAFVIRLCLFLLLPFLGAELLSRHALGKDWSESHWYIASAPKFARTETAIVLVGSSKTAAAIDPDYASELLSKSTNGPVVVFNMALGYSTLAEHYLGLKQFLAKRKSFKRVLIAIEAPNGFPLLSTWKQTWVRDEAPELIMPLFDSRDLQRMWTTSDMPLAEKAYLTAGHWLACVHNYNRYRRTVSVLPEKLFRMHFQTPDAAINKAAGMAQTKAAIQAIRENAIEQHKQVLLKPLQCPSWTSDMIFPSMVALCQANGSRVCTFTPPMLKNFSDNARVSECATFSHEYAEFCKDNSIPSVPIAMKITESDLPDLLHLKDELRRPYTEEFARAIAKMVD